MNQRRNTKKAKGMISSFFQEIHPTPWWEWIFARLFGRRFTGGDRRTQLTGYMWRSKFYITSVDSVDEGRQAPQED